MFKVGQEVYCIDTSDPHNVRQYFQEWVQESTQYTVRRCEGSMQGGTRVLLDELKNDPVFVPEIGGKAEQGFAGKRFVTKEQFLMGETMEAVEELELVN